MTKKLTSISTAALSALVVIILGLSNPTTANPNNTINTNALVGNTAGSLSIEQGVANYTIPVTLPPGIAGMKPKLSIHYNSNTGNGLLGMGFSLGGLSTIHRCGKTIATDGVKGGINYDGNDRYCLDGQRLIAISGQAGQAGSEYRTEIDTFSRIQYNGNYWRVETKAGQTFEYGNTEDAKIEAQGKSTIRLWAVNKISDASNNTITYHYHEDNLNGEYHLQQINYANNSNNVKFVYENREDKIKGTWRDARIQTNQRLSKIQTFVNGTLVRDYQVDYQYTGEPKISQITKITQKFKDKSLNPTVFFLERDQLANSWAVWTMVPTTFRQNGKQSTLIRAGQVSLV